MDPRGPHELRSLQLFYHMPKGEDLFNPVAFVKSAHMNPQFTLPRKLLLLVPMLALHGLLAAQPLPGRLIYSRGSEPNGAIWLNDGLGHDSLFLADGQEAKIDDSGRYIFFLQGTSLTNPFYEGTWMRYSTVTGSTVPLMASTDYLIGYDLVQEDSSEIVSYYCSIAHDDFDGAYISTVSDGSCYDDAPDLSADLQVVFHNAQASLFTVELDGTGRTAIPNTTPKDSWPAWSPDGRWILFGRGHDQLPGAGRFGSVNFYKVKADGDSLTQLTQNPVDGPDHYTSNAVWSADGTAIITAGLRNGHHGLMAIAADGSGLQDSIATTPGDTIRFVSGTVAVALSTGIPAVPAAMTVQVWPVPARDQVNVSLMRAGAWLGALFDAQGRKVWSGSGADALFTVPMQRLDNGLFQLRITAQDGSWSVGRSVLKE